MLTKWISDIEFAYPLALVALLIIPVIIWDYVRTNNRVQASMMITTTQFLNKSNMKSLRTNLRHLPFGLRCLSLLLIMIALARPQKKYSAQKLEGEGIDIVLCFDISGSMTARDLLPNRLEAAKEVAVNFVNNRPGDRIGITIFSNQSFTLCPLTLDHNTVLNQIQNIQSGYLQDEGTAIGSGLATSVDRLRAAGSKSKVVVLLTDGVDFGGVIPPDIAKEMAKLYKIKVYTIGVGSENTVEEVVNGVTEKNKLEYNEGLLKELADFTGGQYFHANDKTALKKVYEGINLMEKSRVEVVTFNKFTDNYRGVLIAGLLILVIELVVRYAILRKFP